MPYSPEIALALRHTFLPDVAATYIIYLPSHPGSVAMAQRAFETCQQVDQPNPVLYPGFDGTGGSVQIPEHLSGESWPAWIKLYDERLTSQQIGCAMSHFSLWANCMVVDRPIVILEHDSVMLRPYRRHRHPNTIGILGWQQGHAPTTHLVNGGNWQFLGGTHAYAIDPLVAHRLFAILLDRGFYAPSDIMVRLADVALIPEEGYAGVIKGESTVPSDMQGGLFG